MSENTKIEWCDHTFNPWEGCTKVGPGCDHCYAETRNARFGGGQAVNWGPGAPRRRTSIANWRKPLQWQDQAGEFFKAHGHRQRVFCASLADVFDNEVSPEWRADLFSLILRTPALDWLLLTKRIGNVRHLMPEQVVGGALPNNVWLGATITSQEEADRDIRKLLAVPAHVRFLSMEPLLGPVNLADVPGPESGHGHHEFSPIITINALKRADWQKPRIDWVIVGGESGPGARPMHPDWARSLRDQCQVAGVPFLFKQWGEYTAHDVDPEGYHPHLSCIDAQGKECALSRGDMAREKGEPWWFLPPHPGRGTWGPDGVPPGVVEVRRVGKKAAGRLLDGVEHNGFPETA